jgi:hypothetical protein
MSRQPKTTGDSFRLTAHPPERRKRPTSVTVAQAGCTCCSCSSCCLHTFGGLVGAMCGSTVTIEDRQRRNLPHLASTDQPRRTASSQTQPTDASFTTRAPGGIVAAVPELMPQADDESYPFPFRRDELEQKDTVFSAATLYWIVVGFLVLLVAVCVFVQDTKLKFDDPVYLIWGVLVALLWLPVIQLVASLLSLILIAIFYRDKRVALVRIGYITLWSMVLASAGALLMLCLFSFEHLSQMWRILGQREGP